MDKNTKVLLGIGIFALLIVVVLTVSVTDFGSAGKYDDFAECLTNSGVKMYGAYWCPHCTEQKNMFGKSWSKINYIECSLPNMAGTTQFCVDAEIAKYPTWEFSDGSRIEGVLSFQVLSSRTDCSLES